MDLRAFPRALTSEEIAGFLGREHVGHVQKIEAVSDLAQADASKLFFQSEESNVVYIAGSTAIVSKAPEMQQFEDQAFILSPHPRLDFARVIARYLTPNHIPHNQPGYIADSVELDEGVNTGYGAVIEEGVIVGRNTSIGSNVVIKAGVKIGSDCVVADGAIIGNDGLTIARDENGHNVPFRHLGDLHIGNNVEIGPNATVGRATLGGAEIGNGVIIGPQVNVGHNGTIKEEAIITGCSCISGGVTIGHRTWLGTNCTIIQKVQIGDDCTIGIGAIVTRDVADGSTLSGLPAMGAEGIADA